MTPLWRLGFLGNCPERLVEVVGLSRHLFSLAIAAQPRPSQGKPLVLDRPGASGEVGWPTFGLPPLEKIIGGREAVFEQSGLRKMRENISHTRRLGGTGSLPLLSLVCGVA